MSPGDRLRALRDQLGLTIRDVESASMRLAEKRENQEYVIQISRLSDFETKGILPSVFRFYTLAVIYRRDIRELMEWFGIDLASFAADLDVVGPPRSHRAEGLLAAPNVKLPVRMDPAFDLKRTTNLGRMVESWGVVPVAFLTQFDNPHYTYGYVGTEDLTLYPLLLPGSFVQIDESKNQVAEGVWRSEYERPIYFVETREGFFCSWCSLEGEQGERLVLQPHPLSPVKVRSFKHPRQAEVIGQVVAMAMRLGEWRVLAPTPAPRALPAPN